MSDSDSASTDVTIKTIKAVVVGDGAVGKTALCNVFVNKEFPADSEYAPTVFENYNQSMSIGGKVSSSQ